MKSPIRTLIKWKKSNLFLDKPQICLEQAQPSRLPESGTVWNILMQVEMNEIKFLNMLIWG